MQSELSCLYLGKKRIRGKGEKLNGMYPRGTVLFSMHFLSLYNFKKEKNLLSSQVHFLERLQALIPIVFLPRLFSAS